MSEADLLHLSIAVGPLAVYLLLLGLLNLSRRPFVTTGARDTAALGIAISGLVAVGPMELFLPESTANRFGGYAWLLLFTLFSLCLTLLILLMRPRIVIYNVSPDQLRPILAQVVGELDREARWAGEALTLPQLSVHLCLESNGLTRNAQLVATGPRQDYGSWRKLEMALQDAMQNLRGRRNPVGYAWLVSGLVLVGLVTRIFAADPVAVKEALRGMLRM